VYVKEQNLGSVEDQQGSIFPITDLQSRRLAAGWLILSIASLVAAGLFSIVLVLSRTPYVQNIFPWVDFFHSALIVHVDLSILIWFLCFGGVLWSINSLPRWSGLGWLSLSLSASGGLTIAISPFLGAGRPLMNNYVPVLQDPVFFAGLGVFGAGILLMLVRSLAVHTPLWSRLPQLPLAPSYFKRGYLPLEVRGIEGVTLSAIFAKTPSIWGTPVLSDIASGLRFGIYASSMTAIIGAVAIVWSYLTIPDTVQGTVYYEVLFWGGGHILQFVYLMLMLVAWLWLAHVSGIPVRMSPPVVILLFGLLLAVVLLTPVIYLSYDTGSFEHRQSFTMLMKYGMGLPPLLIGMVLLRGILQGRAAENMRHIRAALIASMVLFGAGGVIGFLIHGMNVTIPSHYHGAIVGVTLSFMGLTYYLLPHLGFRNPAPRLSTIQPCIYGIGQLLHILGLAWAGGYGVQRKVAGSAQGLDSIKKVLSMGLMGIGGFIAVIGGFMFLVVVINALWPTRKQ